MTGDKIPFFKKRDFTDRLNVSIEFIRQNFQGFFIPILYILGPIAIITGLITFQNIRNTSRTISEAMELSGPVQTFGPGEFTWLTLILVFLSVLGPVMVYSIIYNYMKLYHEHYPRPILPGEVINRAIEDFPGYLALAIIIVVITVLGALLCVLPGIYLGVVLSFSGAVFAFEKGGITGAVERCFQLIKQNWWETFGLVIITFLLGAVISIIFDIPLYIFFGVGVYSVMIQPDVTLDSTSFFVQAGVVSGLILAQFGQFISYIIPLIAVSFQYFHLVEEKESVGLLGKIDNLKT